MTNDTDKAVTFATDVENGLTSEEVRERRRTFGYNEVPEKRENPLIRFVKKFWGLTPWMLELTIALTWIIGKYLEAYIVIALLFFNGVLSFIQEAHANAALAFLKQRLAVNARVKRDGKWDTLPARELVPGDVIRLRAGDVIPADVSIAEGEAEVDQSALTGESLTVEKKVTDTLYSGAVVKRGEITGIVAAIGAKTYFGRTVELVEIAKPKLHMEEVTSKVVQWLLAMVGALVILGLILTMVRGFPLLDILPLSVVLLLSAIPIALPTMFTLSMALGSLALAKKGALLTRLSAIEDAATMDVLCADKTGTITLNKLSVADIMATGDYSDDDVLLYGALASQEANQDPIDLAFLSPANERQVSLGEYVQDTFIPFDPATRRTEATVEREGDHFFVMKGAVNVILPLCKDNRDKLTAAEQEAERRSIKGYRDIAVAKGASKDALTLVGIIFLYDKPRDDSPTLIRELKNLGISVKMLTGDALPIAQEVAGEVGLDGPVARMTNVKPRTTEGGDSTLRIIEESDGFAEIYPEDKYLIVQSLQKGGHITGMTGDGVNDTPALKQAEVGIAVSNATDVAKKAASAVLTTEGLEGIVDLVKNGRMVYRRIVTWVLNKIVKTFQVVVFVIFAFVLTGQYVVSIFSMILFLFLTDFVTLSLSTDNVRYSGKPDSWNITGLVAAVVVLGVVIVAESMLLLYAGAFWFGLHASVIHLQTFVFDFLVFFGLFDVLLVRERQHFWTSRPSTPLMVFIVGDILFVLLISTLGMPGFPPIRLSASLTALAFSFGLSFAINDSIKVVLMRMFRDT
jgi:H+-transporting ATPase